MSDHEYMTVIVDIADSCGGHALAHPPRRKVRIEVTLPTGEGSEGPNLEGNGWEDALSTFVQRCASAAYACLAVEVEEVTVADADV